MTPAELARLRQGTYRLFSQTLLYPNRARSSMLATVEREMGHSCEAWMPFSLAETWRQFRSCLKEFSATRAIQIENEYVSLFLANATGVPSPIYESAYFGDGTRVAGWLLAQLDNEYGSMGRSLSPGCKERPDHAAVELEFMAFLCDIEADAWENRYVAEASQAVERERAFLVRHLARWLPAFASRVASVNDQSRFAVITTTVSLFVLHDADLLTALIDRVRGAPARTL